MIAIQDYSKNLEADIVKAVSGALIPVDNRSRIGGALFDIVHEHHQAVLLLIGKGLVGSAGALLRSIFEAYVRGVWFLKCADDSDISRFTTDDQFKKGTFEERIEEIKKVDGKAHGGLLDVKNNGWEALNSYTHGGFRPVSRRFLRGEMRANYSEEEILEIERVANSFAILAVFQIAELGNNEPLFSHAERMARQFKDFHS